MQRYIFLRVVQGVVAILGVSLIVFVSVRLTGDMERFLLPPDATADDFARVRSDYHLNDPLPAQYVVFLRKAVTGDFGRSWRWQDPAFAVVTDRLPATLQLAAFAA